MIHIPTIILIWIIIDIIIFPKFSKYLFSVQLNNLRHWQGILVFLLFFPIVCGFLLFKLSATIWRK